MNGAVVGLAGGGASTSWRCGGACGGGAFVGVTMVGAVGGAFVGVSKVSTGGGALGFGISWSGRGGGALTCESIICLLGLGWMRFVGCVASDSGAIPGGPGSSTDPFAAWHGKDTD